jgi:hypothetical protein
MTYAEFQEHWEIESDKERTKYDSKPISELIADVEARRLGNYFQIWYSLGARATLEDIKWTFFDVLKTDLDYLIRYHCAKALISIARLYTTGIRPEELSGRNKFNVDENLSKVQQDLEKILGKRNL